MTAEEYFRKQLGEYTKSGIYLDKELRFKASVISEIMEDYHKHKLKLLGIANVVGQSEQYFCCKDQINQRCSEQCLGCFQFETEN